MIVWVYRGFAPTAAHMAVLRTAGRILRHPVYSGLNARIKSSRLTRRVRTWIAAGETCGSSKIDHDPGEVVRWIKERLMVERLKGYSTLFNPAKSRTKPAELAEFSELNSVYSVNSVSTPKVYAKGQRRPSSPIPRILASVS
jgi:hypothetical protein